MSEKMKILMKEARRIEEEKYNKSKRANRSVGLNIKELKCKSYR